MKKEKFSLLLSTILVVFSAATTDGKEGKGRTYYRYINERGVKVINHTIPPKYAQLGYEVVNASGQVLRVVPPAPSEEELAQAEASRKMKRRYDELQKRYKSLEDIEAAKRRRLSSIDTNIAILKANINTLNTQIDQLTASAASYERERRQVPASVLNRLKEAKTEKTVAGSSLKKRQAEYESVEQQFNQDILAFTRGLAKFN